MRTNRHPPDYERPIENIPNPSTFTTCGWCGDQNAVRYNGGYICYTCDHDTTMLTALERAEKAGVDVDRFLAIMATIPVRPPQCPKHGCDMRKTPRGWICTLCEREAQELDLGESPTELRTLYGYG